MSTTDISADIEGKDSATLAEETIQLGDFIAAVADDDVRTLVHWIVVRCLRIGTLDGYRAGLEAGLGAGFDGAQKRGVQVGYVQGQQDAARKLEVLEGGRKRAAGGLTVSRRDELGRPTEMLEERDGRTWRRVVTRDEQGRVQAINDEPLDP